MAAVVGTRSTNEYSALLDRMISEGDDVEEPWARCFFKISNELKSPLGQFVQSYTPNCLRWLADPVLSFLFDGKLINVDSQHFRRKIRELVGTYTFQEAFDKTSKIINITVDRSDRPLEDMPINRNRDVLFVACENIDYCYYSNDAWVGSWGRK